MYKKKRDLPAKLLFWLKPIGVFLRSRCRPLRWILKSLMTLIYARALLGKSCPGIRSRLRI